jgi:hypothetical protein
MKTHKQEARTRQFGNFTKREWRRLDRIKACHEDQCSFSALIDIGTIRAAWDAGRKKK